MGAVHRDEQEEGIHAGWARAVDHLALALSWQLAFEHRLGRDVPHRRGPAIMAGLWWAIQGTDDGKPVRNPTYVTEPA